MPVVKSLSSATFGGLNFTVYSKPNFINHALLHVEMEFLCTTKWYLYQKINVWIGDEACQSWQIEAERCLSHSDIGCNNIDIPDF